MEKLKTGIFVDSENIRACGGFGMRYDVLTNYVERDGVILRANLYLAEDQQKMTEDPIYKQKTNNFYNIVRANKFKIVKKYARHFVDSEGVVTTKANADIELSIDAILQARNLDRVVLLTGDGDFIRLVEALQSMGILVEVMSFNNTNAGLIEASDFYISGYLIPDLLPIKNNEANDKLRGCINRLETGYGFITYYTYEENRLRANSIFFHFSDLNCPVNDLSSKNAIFEFIKQDFKKQGHNYKAIDIKRIDNI